VRAGACCRLALPALTGICYGRRDKKRQRNGCGGTGIMIVRERTEATPMAVDFTLCSQSY
jgi:hypothetical protein